MCFRETRQWSCSCRPGVFYHSCPDNKLRDIELCPKYEIHQSFPNIQCNDCDLAAWPTPPSSPSRIRELKNVFESNVKKDAKQGTDGARGTRHRRDSVGKLEDKCMECRTWGYPCDMKQPHCTSCLRNGTICETTKEWFGRVSGKTASRGSPRPGAIDVMAPAPAPILPQRFCRPRAVANARTEIQEPLKSDITTSQAFEEDYSAGHRAADESLAGLKKNMRGLRAALAMQGGDKRDPRETVLTRPSTASAAHDFSRLPAFMDFPQEQKENVTWTEPVFDQSEISSSTDRQTDEFVSPITRSNTVDDPSSFSEGEDSLTSSDESDLFSPSSESFGDERPPEMSSLETDPGLQSPHLESDGRLRSPSDNMNTASRKVRTAAQNAYKKLKTVARSKKASVAFRRFVESLGSLDDILRTGSQTFEMLVDQETPNSLIQIYCFLHFAYAMSQGDTDLLPKSSEKEYQKGLLVFRSCLPSTPEYEGLHSQRDIFDEIAHHMARELECALRWAKKQNLTPTSFHGLSLEDVLRLHSERNDSFKGLDRAQTAIGLQAATSMDGALFENLTSTSITASWREIQSLRVFNGVTGFLAGLSRFGSPFKLFTGDFCKSIASGIYQHPVYSKGFRQANQVLHADEMRDSIRSEIVSKFDRRLIAHDSLLQALETSLEMVDLGSLITLEDYVDYARGLVMAALVPVHLATLFEYEIIRRSQQLIGKLPAYLLGRVQWPECFSVPASTPDSSLYEPHHQDISISPSYMAADLDFVVNMAQSVPQPEMSMIIDPFHPTESASQSRPDFETADPMDYEHCSAPGSSQPASCSPQPSVMSSTPPPLSTASCSSEDVGSPSSPNSTSTPTTSAIFTCPKCRKTFTNKSNLSRHERTKHAGASSSYKKMLRCPVAGCKTMLGSARAKENMRTHLKKKHGIERPGIEELIEYL
ncbi:hypothetical protein Dda_8837 [Drechslerella dactyloides]|uniref:C2H2-type domain-containing protein n=1 Tax=Drechslerella dactyloides TaxID=74499 RepID=A0AAD6IR65_DREDA|nr:hypothetical protein Dda_8837 [Drechslerella dactyloides]